MPAAKFVKGATTVTFTRAPQRPAQKHRLLQPESTSAGAERVGGEIYDVDADIPMNFVGMPTAELAQLDSFFLTDVRGMVEPFTYNDTDGVAHTVRFAAPQIQRNDKAYGRHDVSFSLVIA